jgi:glutamate--cysteine ligase
MSLDARTGETPPVTRVEELSGWFRARERPREAWKLGLEHEKILLRAGTLDPVPYGGERGVEAVLRAFERHGYVPFLEEGRVIAAQERGLTVSIEPGGQIELSGRPFADVHTVAAELDRHLELCREIGGELGIEFLAAGYRPWGRAATVPWMPKKRYGVMRPFLAGRGRLAEDMMAMTGSTQASFDFGSERDLAEKLRVAFAIQPAVTALFANSPVVDGRESGWLSYRVPVWEETDPARCGIPAAVFAPGFEERPYEAWTEWALDVPMVFVRRGDRYLETGGRTFRAFLAEGIAGERPRLSDWEDHLSTLFTDVRVKGVIEVRGADAVRPDLARALLAFWKGILYDPASREWAWEVAGRWALDARRELARDAGRVGLGALTPDGRTLGALAGELVEAARAGLCRQNCCGQRGEDERIWLAPLAEQVASGRTPAEEALDRFRAGGDRALAAHLRCA